MIATVFLFLYINLLHPLHLSVTDINFNQESKSLEISKRLFVDDLEDALRKKSGGKVDVLNPKDPDVLSKIIGQYILENFSISVDKKELPLQYLGYELEEDAVWVYLEGPKIRNVKSIRVRDTAFFELFDDQLNLVNVKKNDRIRSLKLEIGNEQEQLVY